MACLAALLLLIAKLASLYSPVAVMASKSQPIAELATAIPRPRGAGLSSTRWCASSPIETRCLQMKLAIASCEMRDPPSLIMHGLGFTERQGTSGHLGSPHHTSPHAGGSKGQQPANAPTG
ncbi:hypothetical protein BKA56DRAFT_621602 [Ilyonectria sp. MPI-CAGE-AT-0026]|nr:hypothetical protein BKA56DRAFT_621602 [Ilyonectria sp. MPI-CAGE-AT-0026]